MDEPPANGRNLRLDPQGIWIAESEVGVSYPSDGNDLYYALEEKSFWFRHRNDMIVELLRQFPPSGLVFDVGGGNGYVAAGIERAGWQTVVVEPGRRGAENAQSRGLRRVVCASNNTAGWAPGSLPAVGLFDVLEHIADDIGFLRSLRDLMQPESRLYLTVPAFRFLWSAEDSSAGHYRRYTASSLAHVLKSAGFQVEFQTYLFWFLPLPVFFLRALPSWFRLRRQTSPGTARREHTGAGGFGGWILKKTLAWERSRLARGRTLPVGGSCLAVARIPRGAETTGTS